MSKKVAMLTTHRANNFGAMLQAYSLVMACRELGADAEILDWRCPYFERAYHKAWRMHRNPIPAIKHLVWFLRDEKETRVRFAEFRAQLPKSHAITKRSELLRQANNYDIIIAGSDQIWNPINSAINPLKFDRANLLNFVHGPKKFAYAASIGAKGISPVSLLPEFVDAWKSFDGITMREFSGSDYVGFHIGRKVETVVDPVLLHDAAWWNAVNQTDENIEPNVLLYNIRGFEELNKIAKNIARRNGLKLVDLLVPAIVRDSKNRTCAGPQDFLSYMNAAQFVVTDSFHASAFAAIYGKRLYLRYNLAQVNSNSRFATLFAWMGIKEKAIVEGDAEHVVFCDCSKKDNPLMSAEILRSRNVLKRMVNGTYS